MNEYDEEAQIEMLWAEEHIREEIMDRNHESARKLNIPFAERMVEAIWKN
jgi:hypothetical protein